MMHSKAKEYTERKQWAGTSWRTTLSIFIGCLIVLLTACAPGGEAPTIENKQEPEKRLVKHAMGETWVTSNPQRVIALDTGELDSSIALGITPVGAASIQKDGPFLSYLTEQTKDISNIGTITQPNLEKIASLNPDLILGSKVRLESLYGQLSAIAPTVFSERTGPEWKKNLMLHAEALGKTKEAEQLMATYNQRLQDFKQKMGNYPGKTNVSVIRILNENIRIYGKNSFSGSIITDAGLLRPANQQAITEVFQQASYEQIDLLDADVIFATAYDQTKFQELKKMAQWQKLKAVQAGKVYEVADNIWMSGVAIGASYKVIDDLFKYLVV